MNLTRKHKVYACVLAAGAAALVVDRAILGPPAPARAAPVAVAAAVHGMPTPASAGAPSASPAVEPAEPARGGLAERMGVLARDGGADVTGMRDAFTLPQAWRGGIVGSALGPAARRFLAAHRLEGVMASEKGGYAIVDGRCLYIGQRLDGFTLTAVGERTATLVSADDRVELELPQVGAPRPPVR